MFNDVPHFSVALFIFLILIPLCSLDSLMFLSLSSRLLILSFISLNLPVQFYIVYCTFHPMFLWTASPPWQIAKPLLQRGMRPASLRMTPQDGLPSGIEAFGIFGLFFWCGAFTLREI